MDIETFIIEQCHAFFDGTLNKEEQEQFLDLVKTNPAYQKTFQSLWQVHEALNNNPGVDPPSQLENTVMLAIEKEQMAEEASEQNVVAIKPKSSGLLKMAAAILVVATTVGAIYLVPWQQTEGGQGQSPHVAVLPKGQLPGNQQTGASSRLSSETSAQEDALLEQALQDAWMDVNEGEHSMALLDDSSSWVDGMVSNN